MTWQIVVLCVLGCVVALAVGIFVFVRRGLDNRADKYTAVGQTVWWQDGKLPFLGRAVVEYTKRGKPFQVPSEVMLKSKRPRTGSKAIWVIHTYRVEGREPVSIAKRVRHKRKTEN